MQDAIAAFHLPLKLEVGDGNDVTDEFEGFRFEKSETSSSQVSH